jgi:hypothetical protein
MDVGVLSILAVAGLVVVCAAVGVARRRSAREAAQTRARHRSRRRHVPEVSANVRGLPAPPEDLWSRESERRPR